MMTEKPILDYGESIMRGNVERERLDKLIAACGGLIPYMTGPRYNPQKGRKEDDSRREAGHDKVDTAH